MKYPNYNVTIPLEKRRDFNKKILMLIDGGDLQEISHEDIFNAYTGTGGLHGLKFTDYDNYKSFSNDKKWIEEGQFFTDPDVCKDIVVSIRPDNTDLICDMACGSGNFFNYLPVESNVYGCDTDGNAVKVAKCLYPDAHIIRKKMQSYEPYVSFDLVIGNPPFNLDINGIPSQLYFCMKAYSLLKPAGLLVAIFPESFLKDPFLNKSAIEIINKRFNFILQYRLKPSVFRPYGVNHFKTKVLVLQKKSEHLKDISFKSSSFVTGTPEEIYNNHIKSIKDVIKQEKAKFFLEFQRSKDNNSFDYKIMRLLYHIKSNTNTAKHYGKCLHLLERYKTQERPQNISDKEWSKKRISKNKVLNYFKSTLKYQHLKPVDKIVLVKTDHGFKLKPYSPKTKRTLSTYLNKKKWKFHELVQNPNAINIYLPSHSYHFNSTFANKLIDKKCKDYDSQSIPFDDMRRNQKIDDYIKSFSWINREKERCFFTETQIKDIGRIFQKNYSTLNWWMGSGKTSVGHAWAKYNIENSYIRKVFIISDANTIFWTWTDYLKRNDTEFLNVRNLNDVNQIQSHKYILITLKKLIEYQKFIKKQIRRQSRKVALLFDESDEATNHTAKQSKAVLNCFRKVKRKLLATGTITRNSFNELFTQLEIMYNNSYNMLCTCKKWYKETRTKEDGIIIKESDNPHYLKPFDAYYGNGTFKSCFNPHKTTIFGIKRHNQDVYNIDQLALIIAKSRISRTFKEIAGDDKYTIVNHRIQQNRKEHVLYENILNDFHSMVYKYFKKTGHVKKDNALKIIRQIMLLIRATSTPHLFKEFPKNSAPSIVSANIVDMPLFNDSLFENNDNLPNKFSYIKNLVSKFDEKISIGCTSIKGVNFYFKELSKLFPHRDVFLVKGAISIPERKNIVSEFEETRNGILVCMQQSLKSSINIPSCNKILVESLLWNIPRIFQHVFRFIRFDSKETTEIHFINYENTIEMNLMALLMAKEKLNHFIRTLDYKSQSEIFDEFGFDINILDSILTREYDKDGRSYIKWGCQNIS